VHHAEGLGDSDAERRSGARMRARLSADSLVLAPVSEVGLLKKAIANECR